MKRWAWWLLYALLIIQGMGWVIQYKVITLEHMYCPETVAYVQRFPDAYDSEQIMRRLNEWRWYVYFTVQHTSTFLLSVVVAVLGVMYGGAAAKRLSVMVLALAMFELMLHLSGVDQKGNIWEFLWQLIIILGIISPLWEVMARKWRKL